MANPQSLVASPFDPQALSLAERARRQLATYWRIRLHKTLDRLEQEARRMLALEAELSAFAEQYVATMGPAMQQLALLQKTEPRGLQEIAQQSEARAARRQELKLRYRALAKEIHPDRAMLVAGNGAQANHMHALNDAYAQGDLAVLLRLEAMIWLGQHGPLETLNAALLESALHDIARAADTYQHAYRALLHSPLNQNMLHAISAQAHGWDWLEVMRRNVEKSVDVWDMRVQAPSSLSAAA